MDLFEVYLRQFDEKLTKQLEYHQIQINLQKEQIEILQELNTTNKDMETYIKAQNQKQSAA